MNADQHPTRINSLGYRECPPDWQLNPERTRAWVDLDIWFLVGGRGTVDTPEGKYALEPGTCLLMRGGEDYTFSQDPENRLLGYYAHFQYLDAKGNVIPHQGKKNLPRLWRCFPRLSPVAELFHRAWVSWKSIPADVNRANRWFEAVLMEMADFDRAFRARGNSLQNAQMDWVHKVAERIESAPHQNFSISHLAAEAGYSRTYFYRIFRKYIGMSPQQFTVEARMRHARSLLIDSDYTIAEIASLCGYADIYFFSRHFKQRHRINPSVFRQKGGHGLGFPL